MAGSNEKPSIPPEILSMLRESFAAVQAPVPLDALALLHNCSRQDTGGSQAARYFLFWLTGEADPTGFAGDGGLELRRLDGKHRQAALDVLSWWSGPIKSDRPLYDILADLRERFTPVAEPGNEERPVCSVV